MIIIKVLFLLLDCTSNELFLFMEEESAIYKTPQAGPAGHPPSRKHIFLSDSRKEYVFSLSIAFLTSAGARGIKTG